MESCQRALAGKGMGEFRRDRKNAYFHLPGLFEFYEFYRVFLPMFFEHREFFYDWCRIGSVYGSPAGCCWNGGRTHVREDYGDVTGEVKEALALLEGRDISARLTFSNSQLTPGHLSDRRCNRACRLLEDEGYGKNGVIVHSELLREYLENKYPGLYLVSSTTKVLMDFEELRTELLRDCFSYVVPDFRLNKALESFKSLPQTCRDKAELLVNEGCYMGCRDRKECYENVSQKNLGEECEDFICTAPGGRDGYVFSRAMRSPAFISLEEIKDIYLPMGISNFKIEGRGLGSALLLEFILYYMTKPECQLQVREGIYLDNMLDLF